MLPGFTEFDYDVNGVTIHGAIGGKGEPILLLHGYPQTHAMWLKIAPILEENFTVIATDLRGYGDSSKPPSLPDHSTYSKRAMAADQVGVMAKLGYDRFYLMGHDRGARVAHRLAKDYPTRVKKLILLDIAPTLIMYENLAQDFATAYYHWLFLIQPFPFPETLIGADPVYFLRDCLGRWSRNRNAFSDMAMAEYERCFSNLETIRATCEDYRASATIDLQHDRQDRAIKISCPLLVLWGKWGVLSRHFDMSSVWDEQGLKVQGKALDCGHFLPEEAPEDVFMEVKKFNDGLTIN
ncbi:MAG: alpha/beta hydrolase [Chlorogloea purpurea SAG 13.99]|nr:alpha/beta hydrolase [Chlorogloea purpurea SAG 13.99]